MSAEKFPGKGKKVNVLVYSLVSRNLRLTRLYKFTPWIHSRTTSTPWGAYTPIADTTIIPGATE